MTCKKQAFVARMDLVLTQHALGKNENMNICLFCQDTIYVKIKSTFLLSNLSISNPLPPSLLAEAVHKVSLLVKEFPTETLNQSKP